ncbi:MAG: cytochrome c oxidase subunit, partial [Thermoleophilaceae bacterium]|nr:cytochrome c oxidase subunit [Thermoleophilaceae bacterium]
MATIEHAPERSPAGLNGGATRPEIVMHGYKEKPKGWLSWLTTVDHKRIGIMYMAGALMFFCIGGVEALIMRTQLAK